MAVSPQLDNVIQLIKDMRAKPPDSIQEARGFLETMVGRFVQVDTIEVESVDAGGVPGEWVVAPEASPNRVILYLHGGAYTVGSPRLYRHLLHRLSHAAQSRVLGLDYRLAPEHPFPAAVEDATCGYRWLLSQGFDAARITIVGDSCGGGLTLATMVNLRDLGTPLPAAAACISPWVDLECTGESLTTNAEVDPFIQTEHLQRRAKMYLRGSDPREPLASPLYADLHGLPPLLIPVGAPETLLDDATRFADAARAAGVDVELEVWDDMVHVWPLFAPILQEGQQTVERIGEFVRQHTN